MKKIIKMQSVVAPVAKSATLNEQQEAAIANLIGRHVINSGAGTGKSTVLVERMSRIRAEYPDATVLMLAFSRDAALELKSRVGTVSGVTISTLHSLAFHILKSSGWQFTVDSNTENQKSAITALITSRTKTSVEEVTSSFHSIAKSNRSTLRVRQKYLRQLKENHQVTFDTLIVFARSVLKNAKLRSYWQNRYDFVQIDEVQDLDQMQVALIEILTAKTNNICVCGDFRQQIFSFRGSAGAMERLSQNAVLHNLSINYRCSPAILNLANEVMSEYSPLIPAVNPLFSMPPTFFTARDAQDEAKYIATEIERLHAQGQKFKDMAIIYRSSTVAPAIVQELLERKIPFITKSPLILKYNSRPHREIIALFKFMQNQSVDNLREILPIFYLKKTRINEIIGMLPELSCTLLEILPTLTQKPQHYAYVSELATAVTVATEMTPAQALRHLVKHGLNKYFGDSMTLTLENIITDLQKFPTIADFLNHVVAVRLQFEQMKELAAKTDNLVTLTTIHAAKGLEWRNVFLAGCAEGLLPSNREGADLDEEKRLTYVGITRARDRLYCSYAKFSDDSVEPKKPCRFLAGHF